MTERQAEILLLLTAGALTYHFDTVVFAVIYAIHVWLPFLQRWRKRRAAVKQLQEIIRKMER